MQLRNKIWYLVVLMTVAPLAFGQIEAAANSTSTLSCAPPNYSCARSDLNTVNNLNPAPSMSKGQNTIVTPSDFNLPIVRVTDAKSFGNKTLTTTLSGSDEDNVFNTNDTFLIVTDTGGWRYPVSFDPSTMQVLNSGAWTAGTNQFRWSGSGSFSRTQSNVIYAVPGSSSISGFNPSGTALYKFKLSGTSSISATATEVFDFANCQGMAKPYSSRGGIWRSILTISSGDKRFAQAFSNKGGQNSATDVTVYDAPSGQCYRYDTEHAQLCTSSGCVPMSLSDEFTIHEVYLSLDGNYLRLVFNTCTKGGCTKGSNSNPYFWEIGTTNVTRCYSSSKVANCTGHMVEGSSNIYNATTWPQTAKRAFSNPLLYAIVNLVPGDLTPGTDTHFSNNAADPKDTYPYWATNVQNVHTAFGKAGCNKTGNIYEGCTFPGPLYGEIFGITQNGGYIRAAHSYNSGSSSYFNCSNTIGAVSQTGKFFAWTSDWLTTLGTDNTGKPRCDVFIVNLAAQQGAKN